MASLAASISTTEPREQQTVSSDRSLTSTSLILVVDDDRATRMLLKLAMEEEGYRVLEAKDGEQCLAAFTRWQPDIVLLDAIMPEMDGFTCCERLRELPGSENTPILIITALDDQDSIDRAFGAGATDYITKPIYWAVLAQRVKRLLATSEVLKQFENLRQQLERQQQWKALFDTITRQLSQPFDLRQLLNSTVTDLRIIDRVDRVILYQQQNRRPGKRFLAESLAPGYTSIESLVPEEITLDAQYQERYEQNQIVTIPDLTGVELPEDAIARWNELGIKAALMVPIVLQERLWGVICVHQCQTSRVWEPWEIEQFNYLSDLLAGAIYQAQLRQQLSMNR
ncbi:MAG: response regulator [Hydrococcus sp. Prado102]|jgi:CheY-like chemotaxis protein|nr:response regulator [Hydrococcus sp. Prado102]